MTETVRVQVQSIAAGGDGVARVDGLAVFVPRTAPGDVADVRLERKARLGRGALLRLVSPASERVAPRCRHFESDRCGGCQLQHLSYPVQLEAKRHIVRDALGRIGKRDVALPPIDGSPVQWEYRSRLALTLRRAGADWRIGLHAFDDPDAIFDLAECPITDPEVVAGWRHVRAAAEHLPDGGELRGVVRAHPAGLSLELHGGVAWERSSRFVAECPVFSRIRWRPAHGRARVVLDRPAHGEPPDSFRQVNAPMAKALHAAVVARACIDHPRLVVDAYAGTGATAEALAALGATVSAIERDRDAARFAARRLSPPSRALSATVEDALETVLPADLVILNPPRSGVDARVPKVLERRPVRRILYVSCDPATLARDVRALPGYTITHVRLFDMFPQTSHVETLCELTRAGA